MTPLLICIVGCVYGYIATEQLFLEHYGMSIMYYGYMSGNIGLFIIAKGGQ